MNNRKTKNDYKEMFQAFLEYLRRPKTIFDFKDRLKAIIIMAVIIIILQIILRYLLALYN